MRQLTARIVQASSLDVFKVGFLLSHTHLLLAEASFNDLREHAGLCVQSYCSRETTDQAGQRRMTPSKTLPGQRTTDLNILIPMLDLTKPMISFMRLPLPETGLAFPPRPRPSDSKKRGRAAADVDGEHSCLQKKKRRLRLFLITSRLSPQFSHPATNIVDRGSSKIAVWVKQRAVGRNLLRKAAILNHVRRSAVAARDEVSRRRLLVEQEKEQQQLALARLAFKYGSIDTYTRPVHSPTEPVPLAATLHKAGHINTSVSPHSRSPSTSPITSRSPSPTSTMTSHPLPPDTSSHNNPNTAYAYTLTHPLSPPRSHTRSYEPHLPSPLGLSNYDALDAEDDDQRGPTDREAADLYARFDDDDDDEEDRFSYLWDEEAQQHDGIGNRGRQEEGEEEEEDDRRHDSPFSTATTKSSYGVVTREAANHTRFDPSDSLRRDSGMDVSPRGDAAKQHAYFAAPWSVGGGLQYPCAPVDGIASREHEHEHEHEHEQWGRGEEKRVGVVGVDETRRLVPAAMSPNFSAAGDGQ